MSTKVSDELLKLIEQFNAKNGYTAKTDEQIREQAAGEYQSYYDSLRQTAQQTFDRSDLALQQQKEGLGASYDKQREQSAKQYASAYSQTDRAMLGRGMQRSSYGAQTLANLLQEGAEAQQAIGDAQATAEGNIDAQRAQLADQLAQQLGQYDANEQADILARIRELQDQEYTRGQDAQNREDAIALELYQLLYQEGRDQTADSQWQQQFDFTKQQYEDSKKKSSGGGGSSSAANTSGTTTTTGTQGMSWQEFVAALTGGDAITKTATQIVDGTTAGGIGTAISQAVTQLAGTTSTAKKKPATSQAFSTIAHK